MRNDMVRVRDALIEKFKSEYSSRIDKGRVLFLNPQDEDFEVVDLIFTEWQGIVLSYEPSYEDGDVFFPEEYDSLDDLFAALKTELAQGQMDHNQITPI